jgi:hypothetical protein
METEKRNLFIGTTISLILSALLSLIPIWQLIFLAGFIGGVINRRIIFGAISGAVGVGGFWILYIIDGLFFQGLYNLFDIFGSIILGSGFGWLILLIIIIMGLIFGLLGGTLGSAGGNIVLELYERQKISDREVKESSKPKKA